MARILAADKQRMALQMLVEGNSLRSVTRLTGIHRTTVMNLLVRFGGACRQFLDEEMQGLTLRHLQCDEMHTFVAKRQKNLTVDEKVERSDIGEIYLWYAVDTDTKLVPTFALGKRSADNARRFMCDLAGRLVTPNPHATDAHNFRPARAFQPVCQLSTDAFSGYAEAVDLAFGPYVRYGQISKEFRNADRKPGNYSPAEIVSTKRRGVWGIREDEIRSITTSHIERCNLTVRTLIKRFHRLSLGFSKKLDNLAAATALHFAAYNYTWRPRHTDYSGQSGRLRVTPAMAADVTNRLWTFQMLFDEVKSRYLEW
jgi:IS1 family transposase